MLLDFVFVCYLCLLAVCETERQRERRGEEQSILVQTNNSLSIYVSTCSSLIITDGEIIKILV